MDFRRIFDIFAYQQARFPQKAALLGKEGLIWKSYSTQECLQTIHQLSAGLMDLGLKKGDKAALMALSGSPQWILTDIALLQIGVVTVSLHAASSQQELAYMLQDADVKYCFVANEELGHKIEKLMPQIPGMKGIYSVSNSTIWPGWQQLLKEPTSRHLEFLQAYKAAIHEDDLATIIYTSGSTGEPKGVMLSHKNIVSNIKATIAIVPMDYQHRVFSFLPLSHIFERMVTYTYICVGASLYFVEQQDRIMANLKEVRPHYFTAVPRFVEKLHDGILADARKRPAFASKLILWAVGVGERYQLRGALNPWYWLQLQVADWLVYPFWRRQLGGRVKGIIVGSAALQPKLGRLLSAAGMPVKEGYGLTETSPVVACNRFEPGGTRLGTVGIPIPGVAIKINPQEGEEDGEIWVKGPNVMLGYYNKPEATAAAFTEDGWFKTGDVGKIVHKRFLQITGRQKDIFKTSSGKYVAPQELESFFRASPFIEDLMVLGYQRPYVVGLILPDFSALEAWCKENKVHWTAPPYMIHNNKVIQFFNQHIREMNEKLPGYKVLRKFHLLHEPWTVAGGELTQTLKVKREILQQKFSKEIEALYGERE